MSNEGQLCCPVLATSIDWDTNNLKQYLYTNSLDHSLQRGKISNVFFFFFID